MAEPDKVYWAELQNELSDVGLEVVVNDSPRGAWSGKINGNPFTMSIPPKRSGYRDLLIVSLFGQNEEEVVPLLTKFMGYEPFCNYKHRLNNQATATYEWDRVNPQARFDRLSEDKNVYAIVKLERGFDVSSEIQCDMNDMYREFTPEVVAKWEETVKERPGAEWSYNKISGILPFIKKVMPRIGKNQSMFGLSIVSLQGVYENKKEEERIVRYGLEPLEKAGVLSEEEIEQIVNWYAGSDPKWGPHDYEAKTMLGFKKEFEIDGKKYRLMTDNYRHCRDLNLQVLN